MNELAWKMLSVFYGIYQRSKDVLSTAASQKDLETALSISAKEVYDTIGRLRQSDYVAAITGSEWRLTREGVDAWESRPVVTSELTTKAPQGGTKRTMFVEASSLGELQGAVEVCESEGWEFVSLSVAIAAPPVGPDGSVSLVLSDLGGPRLYVAALRR